MNAKQFSLGQIVDSQFGYEGLRISVSVKWNTYPHHLTRQIAITVGKFTAYSALLSEESKAAAAVVIGEILADCPGLTNKLTAAIGEVVL